MFFDRPPWLSVSSQPHKATQNLVPACCHPHYGCPCEEVLLATSADVLICAALVPPAGAATQPLAHVVVELLAALRSEILASFSSCVHQAASDLNMLNGRLAVHPAGALALPSPHVQAAAAAMTALMHSLQQVLEERFQGCLRWGAISRACIFTLWLPHVVGSKSGCGDT
eukprot:356877-Chlamydomonas_euryale.AAC.11